MKMNGCALRIAVLLSVSVWGAGRGRADTVSYTGTLTNPEDTFETTLTLTSTEDVELQTYGFGGGTDAAGTTIAAGGFDPFVGLFSGTGASAVFVDGTSDILSNYTPGCPPAGTEKIGNLPGQCGDVTASFSGLVAGTYTVALTDAAYLPAAVFEGSPAYLGDGFFDLTAGLFQTCADENDCNTDSANWALDVTTNGASSTPEPPSVDLAGLGAMLIAIWSYCNKNLTRKQTRG